MKANKENHTDIPNYPLLRSRMRFNPIWYLGKVPLIRSLVGVKRVFVTDTSSPTGAII
jgi:hypothetical protein